MSFLWFSALFLKYKCVMIYLMVIKFIAQLSPHGGRLRLFSYLAPNIRFLCVCFPAEVWEKEFDPIMVILRTVYRRDVQSAMDRYTAL